MTTSAERSASQGPAPEDDPTPAEATATAHSSGPEYRPMTQREISQAVWALVLGLFVTMIAGTVVANALPRIMADLHGSSTDYTWVAAMTLLMMTATVPLWGKLSDLLNPKILLLLALTLFTIGSCLAGLSHSSAWLIAARGVQGVGAGGTSSLTQVAIAAMVPARERARYNGYIGAAFAVSNISGPLVGGVIVDTPGLGWRWCFYICVPVAVVAFVLLVRTLRLPTERRPVRIDYLGAILIPGGVGLLLLWLTLGGDLVDWLSGTGLALLLGGAATLLLAVVVETRVAEPIVPPRLFRDRTIVLAVTGVIATGAVTVTVPLLFSQYFQLGRGETPTVSGLLTAPMVVSSAVSANLAGRAITRTGRWKGILVAGALCMCGGQVLFATIRAGTPLVAVCAYLALVGVGIGMTQQNLMVAVQNSAARGDLGAASGVVAFFRSLGSTAGVAALGALLGNLAASRTGHGLASAGLPANAVADTHGVPDLARLPAPVAAVVSHAYGDAVGHVWLYAVPLALVGLVAMLLIRETRLATTTEDVPLAAGPQQVASSP
ncbi:MULTISPECIES: MFS transporter [unclassified Frankia]|uniref:MFS transporter n=1 Tax=unclassified Frankia TaxID=2632575 RepID=UPI001EE4099A|nr:MULTISPECIES: MFS transporter [unclassified Frankia]